MPMLARKVSPEDEAQSGGGSGTVVAMHAGPPHAVRVLAASTRIAEHARQLAFCSVTIAAGASDQALYDAVLDLSENVGLS